MPAVVTCTSPLPADSHTERAWLPPEQRDAARAMKLKAAADGQRMPVHVIEGNYQKISGVCPWWDATRAAS